LGAIVHYHVCAQITRLKVGDVKQMSWASYLFQALGKKTGPVSLLAASIDEEINEKIIMAVSSYTPESNEDTFEPDTVFKNFHHQAKVPISDRAQLAGFLMLWLKRCVVPMLSHEVLAATSSTRLSYWFTTDLLACLWRW